MSTEKVAVVTGGNKGIGLAIVRALCKQFKGIVYLTARDEIRGRQAVEELKKEGLNPKFFQLDIDSLESIKIFRDYIREVYGGLDVLVNNAGIAFSGKSTVPFEVQADATIKVNFFGTLNVSNELFPLLRKHARVVHLSSYFGMLNHITKAELRNKLSDSQLTVPELVEMVNNFLSLAKTGNHGEVGWPNNSYACSKIAVSALARIQQRQLDSFRSGDDIIVNSVHPGYVDTDLTSHKGTLTIDQGAVAPTWLALLPENVNEPRGGFVWCDKRIMDWGAALPTMTFQ